ncbi:hypothetical protein M3Y95_00925800 [Aphelenchoides besseyi]|nr:hypothetical protein M3Y95_00925800 [Aphelenchoides besseyi]
MRLIWLLCFFTTCGFAKNTRNSTDSPNETAKFIRGLDRILDVTSEYIEDYSNHIDSNFELTNLTKRAAFEYLNIQKDYGSSLFDYFTHPTSREVNETLELDFLRYRYKCLANDNFKSAHQWDYWNRNNSEFASNLRFFHRSIESLFSAVSDRVTWTVKMFVKRSSNSKQGISSTLNVCRFVNVKKKMSLAIRKATHLSRADQKHEFERHFILATVLYAPLQRFPHETELSQITKYTSEQLDSAIRCVDKIEKFFKMLPHD